MAKDTISILDGSTFLVSDLRGDVQASPDEPHGFFYRDTRFLSRWTLRANGAPLEALSTDDLSYFAAQFFLVPPTGDVNTNPTVSVIRKRAIGDGFHEDVTVLNHGAEPLELELRLEADSDFADLFEVKDALAKRGETYRRIDADTLVLGYRRDEFGRETRIRASRPAEVDEHGLTFRVRVEPQTEWNTCIFVQPRYASDVPLEIKYRHDDEEAKPNIGMTLAQWLEAAPRLESDWDPLEHIYERSLVDLAALRFTSELFPEDALPAAGLPWFMTVFGRDSLITSYQALPFVLELAQTTLRVLAARQATELDGFRDAEPGKILHEIRFGDGRVADGPIATCEIQGYVYDAKLRCARLAREHWDDPELAERLERAAAELRERFNRDFWLEARDCYALALDGEKRPVDSITSNTGHLLWSGIVPEERAAALADHLLGEALFSGWGVRTMAEGEGGYNPIRYHNGTVWPHDNSLIAQGLARYGFREQAARIAFATLEAATYFRYRLPEVFAGYRRGRTGFPVEYPTASSPQAWATGTPLLLLRVLLGLEPEDEGLAVAPHFPQEIERITLEGIPGRWGRADATGSRLEEALA